MMQFFSKTRTLTGLIFILSPLICVLSEVRPLSFWAPFFCSLLFSFFPLRTAAKLFSFRIWLTVCCILIAAGTLFSFPQNPYASQLMSALLLGCGTSGLFLFLPPWLSVGRYVSAGPFLGLAWSCSFLAAMVLQQLLQHSAEAGILSGFILSVSGLLLCSGRSPRSQLLCQPPHDFFGSSMVKSVIFFLCLLTSMGICSGLLLSKAAVTAEISFFLRCCLACGPILSSIFIEKKGIYSSCIFSIFLCEIALLLACSLSGSTALAAGGMFLFLAAGSVTVILPVLAFYLCGRTGYIRGLTPLILCVPVSLLFSWPFWNMTARGELEQLDTAVFLFFLLIMSFLCIFFAWKHRFIILKNNRI